MSFLPFTRPSIDEETIAGVAEVLRSGWIASGPQVQAFEAAFSAYLGGRLVRTFTSATGAPKRRPGRPQTARCARMDQVIRSVLTHARHPERENAADRTARPLLWSWA